MRQGERDKLNEACETSRAAGGYRPKCALSNAAWSDWT